MTQKEAPVVANGGMRHDLWFTEDALYRVEVIGLAPLGLSFALPAIPVAALFVIAGLPLRPTNTVALVSIALLLISAVAAYLVPRFVVNRRRRLFGMTFARAKASKGTQKIPWAEVKRIALLKRTTVKLELRRGRFTTTIRAAISQNDANRLKSIIVHSKAGKSFEFRDGIFK